MGTLIPGATYIYERSNGIIYAREFGKTERHVVGYESGSDHDLYKSNNRMLTKLNEVVEMCEQHPDMRDLMDKLFVLYNLHKAENSVQHHPV